MAWPALPLVLASASPRRARLLREAGVRFEVHPADLPEAIEPGEAPAAYAARLALAKAQAVAARLPTAPPRLVLGADTIVVLDGDVLGKPAHALEAAALLSRLVGRSHRVVTAVALVDTASAQVRRAVVTSTVHMRPAGRAEIEAYAATEEPLDKAGAYALQGEGRRFVAGVEGSETNVIGLPLEETLELLRDAGAARGAAARSGAR
jgi:septum formation protein